MIHGIREFIRGMSFCIFKSLSWNWSIKKPARRVISFNMCVPHRRDARTASKTFVPRRETFRWRSNIWSLGALYTHWRWLQAYSCASVAGMLQVMDGTWHFYHHLAMRIRMKKNKSQRCFQLVKQTHFSFATIKSLRRLNNFLSFTHLFHILYLLFLCVGHYRAFRLQKITSYIFVSRSLVGNFHCRKVSGIFCPNWIRQLLLVMIMTVVRSLDF